MDDHTVTVITMYRGCDAELFTQVVSGSLNQEERTKWRKMHKCDEYCHDVDDVNNMFFREIEINSDHEPTDLLNVDG